MALEDITAKILAKAQEQAERTLSEAEDEISRITERTTARIGKAEAGALEKMTVEAASAEERVVASAQLEAKMETLSARQKVIDTALDAAVETLANTDETASLSFLERMLLKAPFEGEAELIVSATDMNLVRRNLDKLQSALSSAGGTLRLRLSENTRELGGGFVLRQGKIEFNASLRAIRRSHEEELRQAASALLFPSSSG